MKPNVCLNPPIFDLPIKQIINDLSIQEIFELWVDLSYNRKMIQLKDVAGPREKKALTLWTAVFVDEKKAPENME